MVGTSAIDELVLRHQEHARNYAYKLLRQWQVKLCTDEVASNTAYALFIAARNFDCSIGASFPTFLFHHVRGALLKTIRNSKRQQEIAEKLHQLDDADSAARPEEGLLAATAGQDRQCLWGEVRRFYEHARTLLTDLEQIVIRRSVLEDEPLASIGQDLGYSRSHICRVRAKALIKLRNAYQRQSGNN